MLTPLRHPWRMVAALMITGVPCVVVETGPAAAGFEPPTVSVSDATVVEGDSGTSVLQFIVELSEVTTSTVGVDFNTSDGTATVADNDYQATSAHLTIDPGDTGGLIYVNVNGDTQIEPDETLTLTLSNVSNATIADGTGVGTIVNDDEPAVIPAVSVSDATRVEGDSYYSALQFTVTLSEPTSVTVGVDLGTSDGTATVADNDYGTASTHITFLPGETVASFGVVVFGDTAIEPDETVLVHVSAVDNAYPADGDAVGTIVNDDEPPPVIPTVSVSDATVVEDDSGFESELLFHVTLSEPTTNTVTMDVAIADGTATLADNDYEPVSGELTIDAGSVAGAIAVLVPGDTQVEPDETLTLTLSNAVNATIADGDAVGTIDNDDAVVALEETAVSVVEGNSGTTDAVISGVLSSPLATDLDLPGTVSPGSATAGTDYGSPATASIHIPAGSTSGILSVPVNGDTDIEPDETFDVSFELPEPPAPFRRAAGFASAVTVGGTLVAEVTIINDDVVVAPTTSTTTTPTTAPGPTTPTTAPGPTTAAPGPTTSTTTTTTTTDPPTVTSTSTSVPGGILPATRWRN